MLGTHPLLYSSKTLMDQQESALRIDNNAVSQEESSTATTQQQETVIRRQIVPSKAIRDHSSRAHVMNGNRVNSSLTLVGTESTSHESNTFEDKSEEDRFAVLEEELRVLRRLVAIHQDETTSSLEKILQQQAASQRETHSSTPKTLEGLQRETEPFLDEGGKSNATNDDDVTSQDDEEEEDGEEPVGLNRNSFSFLISAHPFSIPFVTGILAFALKNGIFYLVVVNLIDPNKSFNKLGIPVSVTTPVVISQLLAFVISVFTQDDLLAGMVLLYQGYTKDMKQVYGVARHGGTGRGGGGGRRCQWLCAVLFLLVDGLMGLAVTFMLVVTSATVLNVLLNFAAVQFVTSLDEAIFELSEMGFLGRRNQREAALVAESTYRVECNRGSKLSRGMGLTGILAIVLSIWVYLYSLQVRGAYSPKTLIVQFDDQVRRGLGAHSGLYNLQTNLRAGPLRRFHYYEQRAGGGHFGYCATNSEWTFSIGSPVDPCDYSNVVVCSMSTSSLDLSQLADTTWFVLRPNLDQPIPMQNFYMSVACATSDDCSGGRGDCTNEGCQCHKGTFGLQCEYDENATCPQIRLDERFGTQFHAIRHVSSDYDQVEAMTVYHRPVYFNSSSRDVVLFTGLRWAITNLADGLDMTSIEELGSFEENHLFQADTIRSIDVLSDPVYYQTPGDQFSSPQDANWWVVANRGSLSTVDLVATTNPVIFLCSVCSPSNPCHFENNCVQGVCQCRNGGKGAICQIAPISDGKCDPFFNAPTFSYDGGDCCQATCVGTSSHQCGIVSIGSVPNIHVGFPHCIDPDIVGHCETPSSKATCFIPNSQPVRPIGPAAAYPTLSANGRVLVLAEPTMNILRVFDLIGSEWIQRGRTLRGTGGFGSHVAISTTPSNVMNGITRKIPIVLVISESSHVRMFRWSESDDIWLEAQVNVTANPAHMDLASDLMNVPQIGSPASTILLVGKPPPYALTVGGSVPDVVILGDPAIDVYKETDDPNNSLALNSSYASAVAALSPNGNFVVRTDSNGGPRIFLSDFGTIKQVS